MKLIIDVDEVYYKAICERVKHFGKGSVVLPTPEKIIFNGTPLEDIKVEIQNTILEQTYEKGQIAELEKLKAEMEVIHNNYKINIQGYSMSVAQECIDIINQRISELKGGQSDT